jgi:hypothetical protein
MNRRRQIRFRPVGFATDSPLEGDGFELPVPRKTGAISRPLLCHFVIAPIPQMEAPFRIQEPMVRIHLPPAVSHAEGVSDLADEYCALAKAGVIKAVSVGFIPLSYEPNRHCRPRLSEAFSPCRRFADVPSATTC